MYKRMYNMCACVAQWIGRVTPNVVSVGSIPTVGTKNFQLGSTLMVVYILNHCLIDLMHN